MRLCPHLGLQGKARSGVGAQGEGEMPASPVPTSLDVVHMNELVGFGEALVPESEQQAGENAFVLLLTGGNRFITRILAQRGQETWTLATQEGSWRQRAGGWASSRSHGPPAPPQPCCPRHPLRGSPPSRAALFP